MAFATQKNSLKDIIKLNYKGILENCKVSNKHTFVRDIVSKEFHMNPKSGMRFSKFKEQINNNIFYFKQNILLEQKWYIIISI